jgi:prepilin-type N-terminal cleavage/methylation domain-containing protein
MHGLKYHRRRRTGFTLIELLVVMVIIVILATLAVALLPRLNEEQKATRGADQVSGWILISKGRAKRDRHPVGVRLQVPIVAHGLNQIAPGPQTVTYQPWNGQTNQQTQNQVLPDGTLWTIAAGSYLLVADNAYGANAEVVQATAAGTNQFTANFTKQHLLTGSNPFYLIRHLGYVQTLQYIEQPEDFTVAAPVALGQPQIFGVPGGSQVRRIKVTVGSPPNSIPPSSQPGAQAYADLEPYPVLPGPPMPPTIPPDFTAGLGWTQAGVPDSTTTALWPVQQGDYLELLGGGGVHQITGVETGTVGPNPPYTASSFGARLFLFKDPNWNPPTSTGGVLVNLTDQYRIIRGPRSLRGEADLQLPPGVVIDLQTNFMFSAANNNFTLPVDGYTATVDVLFSPSGALVGRATQGTGQVLLWVRDTSLDTVGAVTANFYNGDPALVSIYPRSGFIATHPVDRNNANNPYTFTQDGRSSGM